MKGYGPEREKEELKYIQSKYPEATIINPALLVGVTDMKKFLKIVSKSNQVIASEFMDYVGRGVFSEVARALSDGIKVQVLRKKGGKYTLEPITGLLVTNEHDWKREYAKLIT